MIQYSLLNFFVQGFKHAKLYLLLKFIEPTFAINKISKISFFFLQGERSPRRESQEIFGRPRGISGEEGEGGGESDGVEG
jgi:hypothetical protein